PRLVVHRDATFLPYAKLDGDTAAALELVLGFLDHSPEPHLVASAVASAGALRDTRQIRTGQEGNFWDHLQPEAIFDIQERARRELSEVAAHLLGSMGVEIDPFPRTGE